MTSVSGIYVITNTKNGKVYIGKARDIHERYKEHKKKLCGNGHHNRHLQNAWNKYGEKSFKFQVLEYCSVEQLDEREKHFIAIYKPRGLIYNLTDGGEGTLGHVVSSEARLKISLAKKGKRLPPHTEEAKRKISIGNTGKVRTPEMRKRTSETRKGISPTPFTQEYKDKIGLAHKGRKQRPEAIAKRVQSRSEWWIVIDPDGNEMEIQNLKAFCRENGLDQRHMSKVANGKVKHHKQWRCYRA